MSSPSAGARPRPRATRLAVRAALAAVAALAALTALLTACASTPQDPERVASPGADRAARALAELDVSAPDVEWQGEVALETVAVFAGEDGTRARQRSALRAAADLEPWLGSIDAGVLFAELVATSATEAAQGDGLSGLDGPESAQVSELGWRVELADRGFALRTGLLDANAEFASIDGAKGFLHADAATSPTLLDIPTWPLTAPGIELLARPEHGVGYAAGVYSRDAAAPLSAGVRDEKPPGGTFAIHELDWRGEADAARAAIGTWLDDGGASGAWALGELWLLRFGDEGGLRGFLFAGHADATDAEVTGHALAGLSLRGPFERRTDDEVGVSLSWLERRTAGDGAALELHYTAALSPHASLQLGAQHVAQDGADLLGLTVRVLLGF